jgi:hypothetical protein
MSDVDSVHDWTEDAVPENGRVVAALVRHGVDPDLIHVTPDGTWYVGGRAALGVDRCVTCDNETWDASTLEDGSLVATGDLETVAAAVAEFVS